MAQNLSSLFLDVSQIDAAVRSFDATAGVVGPTKREKFAEYEVTQAGAPTAKLHVYERSDGTTTLMAKVGGNQALSQKIGEHVAGRCKKQEFQQRPLVLKSITQDDWDYLIEFVGTECKFAVTSEPLEHGVRFKVRKGAGDEVFVHRYNTGRFLMQGKAREVYGVIASTLCQLVPDKLQMIEAQLKSYDLPAVKIDDLLEELRGWLPTSIEILGDTGAAIIAPSLALIKLDLNLTDYGSFAYPALRGLECYMKAILAKYGHPVTNMVGFGNCFAAGSTALKLSIRNSMNSQSTCEAVELSYVMYNKYRHSLFHADANPELSRTIETKAEAVSIVHEILLGIENTWSAIPR